MRLGQLLAHTFMRTTMLNRTAQSDKFSAAPPFPE